MPAVKSLSRERVVAAAVDLADAEGIRTVTMRAVGGRLGVEAMSLYHHVRDKTDLLGAMLEQVAAEVDVSDDGPGWLPAVRAQCVATHDALMRHPWSASLWVSLGLPGPARTHLLETLLRRLREGGFGPELLDVAFHTINNHTVGHALQAVGFGTDREQLVAGANAFLDHLDQDTHPELTAHVQWHLDQPPGPSGDAFGLALDLLLEGLERLRSAG